MKILLIISIFSSFWLNASDCPQGNCHWASAESITLAYNMGQILIYQQIDDGIPYHASNEEFKQLQSLAGIQRDSKVLACLKEDDVAGDYRILLAGTRSKASPWSTQLDRLNLKGNSFDSLALARNALRGKYWDYYYSVCTVYDPPPPSGGGLIGGGFTLPGPSASSTATSDGAYPTAEACAQDKTNKFFATMSQSDLGTYLKNQLTQTLHGIDPTMSSAEIKKLLEEGTLSQGLQDTLILFQFVNTTNDKDAFSALSENTKNLSNDDKIRLVSEAGALLNGIYDHDRADAALTATGAPANQDILQGMRTALLGTGDASAGVCRDHAALQARMLQAMGFNHTYVVGYAMPGAYHVTVYTEEPGTGSVVKFNYYNVDRGDGVIGAGALDQQTYAQQTMNFVLAEPSGQIVKAVDSIQGRKIYEATLGPDIGRTFNPVYQGKYVDQAKIFTTDGSSIYLSTNEADGDKFYAIAVRSSSKTDLGGGISLQATGGTSFFNETRSLTDGEKQFVGKDYQSSLTHHPGEAAAIGVVMAGVVEMDGTKRVDANTTVTGSVYMRGAAGAGIADLPEAGTVAPTFYFDDRIGANVGIQTHTANNEVSLKASAGAEFAVLPLANITNFQSGPLLLFNEGTVGLRVEEHVLIGAFADVTARVDQTGWTSTFGGGIKTGQLELGGYYTVQDTPVFNQSSENGLELKGTYTFLDKDSGQPIGSLVGSYTPAKQRLTLAASIKLKKWQ